MTRHLNPTLIKAGVVVRVIKEAEIHHEDVSTDYLVLFVVDVDSNVVRSELDCQIADDYDTPCLS